TAEVYATHGVAPVARLDEESRRLRLVDVPDALARHQELPQMRAPGRNARPARLPEEPHGEDRIPRHQAAFEVQKAKGDARSLIARSALGGAGLRVLLIHRRMSLVTTCDLNRAPGLRDGTGMGSLARCQQGDQHPSEDAARAHHACVYR